MRRHVIKWGHQSLLVKRKEPFTFRIIMALTAFPKGTKLGVFVVDDRSYSWMSLRMLIACETVTGFRKDEVSVLRVHDKFTKKQLSRAALTFRIGGVL